MGKKVIDRKFTAEVKDQCLWVRFEGGPVKCWKLPKRRRAIVGEILSQAFPFLKDNDATLEEINVIRKELRIQGYSYLTKEQRDEYQKGSGSRWSEMLVGLPGSARRR